MRDAVPRLLALGLPIAQIADSLGLPIATVQAIANQKEG
jgi:predicted transposase YdaD